MGGVRRGFGGTTGEEVNDHVGIFHEEVLNADEFRQEQGKGHTGVGDR